MPPMVSFYGFITISWTTELRSLAVNGSIKPYSMNCSGLDGIKPLRY